MIASDSFVLRGNVNLVSPSLLMQEGHAYDMQAGNLVEDKEFLCFPQNSKFPVGKILKVSLGDHSITRW